MDLAKWLLDLGLERYARDFLDNDVDAQILVKLTEADLTAIGIKSVGHRRKLLEAITRLRGALSDESSARAALPAPSEAERRQLSVLYFDMVDAAALSARLDPEDMRETIRAFHGACLRVLGDYDGHAANFFGTCMLAYFGWPRAHEDDAERAVRAGLALVQAVGALRTPSNERLAARVGIATGPVVVGDLIREGPAQEQSAVGETPNLAARLQALAQRTQVVVDEATRRLLGEGYLVQALGSHPLKGIARPVAAYAVSGERITAGSRFDTRAGEVLPPMVGRDQELALLLERWAQAKAGEGTAVLLVGEAGIGKSRIARALLDACASEAVVRIRWQCSPYRTDSALWPVIEQLKRATGIGADDSIDAALDKLEALPGLDAEGPPLLAALLGLDGAARYGALDLASQMQRTRTIEVLVEGLFAVARQQPVLLVVEDAHWIDPTTLLLIDQYLERIDRARFLMLLTSRPDGQPSLAAHPCVTRLTLNRLSRASVEAIVMRLAGDHLLAPTLATIVANTDGVPLFVEELTKAVLETGETSIPASLHGSLMARLDRAPGVKEVAQIAACIGRDFDCKLLQAVAERPEAVLASALDKLAAAELIFRRGDPAHSRCTFKHALVQEAAYESLLHSKRLQLHGRIVDALEADPAGAPPELLAQHASRAERPAKAIDYWQQAGNEALAKSAYVEAASYLGNAIELIPACGDAQDRRPQELEMQVKVGQAQGAARSQGSPEAQKAFSRALELIDTDRNGTFRSSVYYGLWASCALRAEHAQALCVATDFLATTRSDTDDSARMLAERLLGASRMCMGEFAAAREHLERSLQLYEMTGHAGLAAQLGVDPAIPTCVHLGWTLCQLGFADRAASLLKRARDVGSAASQIMARATSHQFRALVGMLLLDPVLVDADARILADLAARHRLHMHQGWAAVMRAWAQTRSGAHTDSVAAYECGLNAVAATGSQVWMPFLMSGLAEALATSGAVADAHRVIEQAIVMAAETGEGSCEAELWRIRGELFVNGKRRDRSEAARSMEHALERARSQQARLWELRAATSLARLWADQGERNKGTDLLAPIHAGFTEGFGTADLERARAFLAEASQ